MPHPQRTTRRLVHAHLPFIFSRLLARFVKVEHMSNKVLLPTPFHKDHAEVALLAGKHGLQPVPRLLLLLQGMSFSYRLLTSKGHLQL
jgi:hypothetical protein